jgi:hypothetical protein
MNNLERPIRGYLFEIESLLQIPLGNNLPGAAKAVTEFLDTFRDKAEHLVFKLQKKAREQRP